MCIIQSVVQLPALQRREKCRIIFEVASDATPNYSRVRICSRERCNQNVKAVGSSASLVMHDVTLTVRGCPNQTLARQFVISDEIGCFPLLPRLCNLSFVVRAKRDNHWWQIPDGTNFPETSNILQNPTVFRGQLGNFRVAKSRHYF